MKQTKQKPMITITITPEAAKKLGVEDLVTKQTTEQPEWEKEFDEFYLARVKGSGFEYPQGHDKEAVKSFIHQLIQQERTAAQRELDDYMGEVDPQSERAELLFDHYLTTKKADLEIELRRAYARWKHDKLKATYGIEQTEDKEE